jgi:Tfp pilus assembly protein PilF
MQTALAFGTQDARLLYHAGMIAAAIGDSGRARTQLSDALTLDASFDPMSAQRARDTLSTLP